jgi:hypothetical protein
MSADKFNSQTPNNEVGLTFTKTRRVIIGNDFGEMATWIKAGNAGDIVWYNSELDEYGIWNLEAGETVPVACTKIVATATIDGNLETTTASNIFWATSSARIGGK